MFRGQLPRLAFIYIPWSTACKKAYKEIKCVQYAHRHYLTMVLSGELRFFFVYTCWYKAYALHIDILASLCI